MVASWLCASSSTVMLVAYAHMAVALVVVALRLILSRRSPRPKGTTLTMAFFHPYCNAGGGGERVLWCAIAALHQTHPHIHTVVYTGDVDATPADILATASNRFGIHLKSDKVTFVYLKRRWLVEAHNYPYCTMLLQSLASIVLGWEALTNLCPDVLVDSMGYAFILPLFRVFGACQVAAYVHYPTISTDMLAKVAGRKADFNNQGVVAKSSTLSTLKLWYYRAFAQAYGIAGACASVVMANSSWTLDHIQHLWYRHGHDVARVYPPCNTAALEQLSFGNREDLIVSVAQFRPEKDHPLQLRALKAFKTQFPSKSLKLVMIGGCRNAGDEARVAQLYDLAEELELENYVDFEIFTNIPYEHLLGWLGRARIGLHTMRDEHFGIGVVEFLAAGAIAVAHDSAGPHHDIVVPHNDKPTGFLATTAEEYAECFNKILCMSPSQQLELQKNARESVSSKFSEAAFTAQFLACLDPVLS
eukprot:m.345667 g.345667  ORF g.345667 m.345667 type:complete len:474 (+) comp16141_c1_seq13:1907-3328(+)